MPKETMEPSQSHIEENKKILAVTNFIKNIATSLTKSPREKEIFENALQNGLDYNEPLFTFDPTRDYSTHEKQV